jgi:hypothetical protein
MLAALPLVSAAETDPPKAKPSPDDTTVWYDCKDLVVEGKGWTETQSFYDRLPAKAEGKVTPSVWGLSHHRAGMCVPFTSDAPSIEVRWSLLPNGNLHAPSVDHATPTLCRNWPARHSPAAAKEARLASHLRSWAAVRCRP